MNKENKILTDFGHCQLMFDNGYIVSIFNGYGSYTEDGDNRRRLYPLGMAWFMNGSVSKDCEVAVISPSGRFVTADYIEIDDEQDNPEVKGFVTSDELADLIHKIKNLPEPLDKTRKEDNQNE